MIYILHTTLNGERAKYSSFERAFKAFKDATRNVHSSAALWYGSDLDKWTRVYCTEHYPTGLTKPYCKAKPHSFFSKE